MKKFLVPVSAVNYTPTGLTGATAASRYAGATASGAPASGTFVTGDWVVAQNGHIFICTAGGTPGTWVDAGGSGAVTSVAGRTGVVTLTAADIGAGTFPAGSFAFTGLITANAGIAVPAGQSLTTGTRSVVTGTRSTTTNATDTVNLGTFATTAGTMELRMHLHLVTAGASITKVYEMALSNAMGTTSTWYLVYPSDASANAAATNDFALEVQRTSGTTYNYRIRQKSIAAAGVITFTVEALGDTAVTFTPSTTVTAAPAAVTTMHPANPHVEAAGQVGIGTEAPAALLDVAGTARAVYYAAAGTTGATAASRYGGATASGAPTTGTWLTGDFVVAQNGHIFICTAGGTPGTWADAGSAGSVSSVAGRSGAVTLTAADIGGGTFPGSYGISGGLRATGVAVQQGNLLSANQASLETDVSDWLAYSNCTIARSTAQALDGAASLVLTSVAAGDMWAGPPGSGVGTGAPAVMAGMVYTATASFRALNTPRQVSVQIDWYANGTYLSSAVSAKGADNAAAWTQVSVTGQAPATATNAEILVRVYGTGGANAIHYVDAIGLYPDPTGNLVDTSDFENTLGFWAAGANGTPVVSTAQAYTGRISMAITSTGAGDMYPASTSYAVVGGQTYTASVYMRAATTARACQFLVNWYDASHTFISQSFAAGVNDSTTGWTRIVTTDVAPANAAYVGLFPAAKAVAAAGETHYWDAVRLEMGPTATTYVPPTYSNLVVNPSFEVDLAGWFNSSRISLSRDTVRSYIGSASGKLTLTAGAVDAIFIQTNVQAGVPLTLQFRAYVPSTVSGLNVGDLYMDLTDTFATYDGPNFGVDPTKRDQWQLVTGTFTPTFTGTANLRFVTSGTPVGTVWVDAIQLELGSVANPYIDGAQGPGYSWDVSNNMLSAAAASFEDASTGGWAAGTNWTIANSTAQASIGTRSLLATRANTTAGNGYALLGTIPCSPNTTYTASAWVRASAATGYMISLRGHVAGGPSVNFTAVANTWMRVACTYTTGATETSLDLFIADDNNATPTSGSTIYIDAVQLEQRTYATPYAQAGTPNAATSTYQTPWYVGTGGVGARFELGRADGVPSIPRLDFHSSGLGGEYDARFQARGGDGIAAHGVMVLQSTDFVWDYRGLGNGRIRLTADGTYDYLQHDLPLRFAAPYSASPRLTLGIDGVLYTTNALDTTSRGTGYFGTLDWLNRSNMIGDIPGNAAGRQDMNTLQNRISGFYNGSDGGGMANTPLGTSTDWWMVLQMRHSNVSNNYGFQIAEHMTGIGTGGLWYRHFEGGVGTDAGVPGGTWERLYTELSNPPPASVPKSPTMTFMMMGA